MKLNDWEKIHFVIFHINLSRALTTQMKAKHPPCVARSLLTIPGVAHLM